MTWADLHAVLYEHGLIRSESTEGREITTRPEAAAGAITGVAYDSRSVSSGQVFVALVGRHADGTAFARQAIDRGAAAVIAEGPPPVSIGVPWAVVSDARVALARLANAFYRNPSRELQVVGVTGTNGKTTTAYLVASIMEAAGVRCEVREADGGDRTLRAGDLGVVLFQLHELVGVGAHSAGCLSRSDRSHVYLAGVKTALRGLQPLWIEAAGKPGWVVLFSNYKK